MAGLLLLRDFTDVRETTMPRDAVNDITTEFEVISTEYRSAIYQISKAATSETK
jgi:hypothetical protein